MYKFVTSMLSAMHMMIESPDPLALLVERYIQQFWSLKRFYEECSKIRYLTSLINIPKLPDVRHCPFICAYVATAVLQSCRCQGTTTKAKAQHRRRAPHPSPSNAGKGSGEHRVVR